LLDQSLQTFTWLHLTDLHVGMKEQDWMWPRLKERFFQDLSRLHSTTGNWDIVIFSGDLTRRGSREDFDRLDVILGDLWQHFEKLGCRPQLIVLPGNHDLTRPEPTAVYKALKRWWEDGDVRDSFFKNADNEYRRAIAQIFSEYDAWVERFASSNDFLMKGSAGLLSGDQSLTFEFRGIKVGVVALNSTWLQLDHEDYLGRLHVDVRQLLSVTNSAPDEWIKSNELNLLVTHHPLDWLHGKSLELWNSEISPPGRFDAHLYGHMHEPSTWTTSFGGGISALPSKERQHAAYGWWERIHSSEFMDTRP
jgi:predicted MPP superfamily phosphohydrolase